MTLLHNMHKDTTAESEIKRELVEMGAAGELVPSAPHRGHCCSLPRQCSSKQSSTSLQKRRCNSKRSKLSVRIRRSKGLVVKPMDSPWFAKGGQQRVPVGHEHGMQL